jgi:catechol 2,3-dioxygenase-like lactoylglutathione lyase family enzyme
MESFIAKLLQDFENGKMSRRQLIQTVAVAATVYAGGEEAANAAPATGGFKTIAVNHISYSCPDYTKARDFYAALMGMENLPEHDNGGQAYLAFGPREGGAWLLPRVTNDIKTPNPLAAPRGNTGAAAAGNAGARGAQGRGNATRPPVQAVIDHIAYTVANFNKERAEAILKDWGLPGLRPDGDSFHVKDPFGYDLQISGFGMTAFGD